MEMVNTITSLISNVVTFAGGLLLLFGAVTLGTNLKDHNGPGMLISAVHEEEGHEGLHLLMVDPDIPAGAKLY